jgi:hypothetical protein
MITDQKDLKAQVKAQKTLEVQKTLKAPKLCNLKNFESPK